MPEGPEEGADLLGEQVRRLQRGKVPAARHPGPPADVEGALAPGAGRMEDLARELRVPRRHVDPCRGKRPSAVYPVVVRPEGRVDRAGHPVNRDVRQDVVTAEARLDVAAAVRPALELLDNPARQPDRRIGEP